MKAYSNILETIGKTPLVKINRLNPNPKCEIYAKIEGFNPAGSVKERIAYSMIMAAEKEGRLKKGQTIVESSSGNTGIGLAMVAAVKGYSVLITMPDNVSVERRQILKAFGATIELTPGEFGTDGAWDKADEIHASNPEKYCRIHQYKDENNWKAHYMTTGPEIWEQMEGKIDYYVVGLGTTGTIVGGGRFLKEKNPNLKIIAVEPTRKHKQQGLRNLKKARVPDIFDPSIIEETLTSEDQDAFEMTRKLCSDEGIFAGISCGAVLWGACEVAKKAPDGSRIVVVLPDRGDKYLSSGVFPE